VARHVEPGGTRVADHDAIQRLLDRVIGAFEMNDAETHATRA
jgi:hypothetical protein